MTEIQRYDEGTQWGVAGMVRRNSGEWIKHSDHLSVVQQLEQRIGRLREALKKAEGFVDRHSEDWYTSGQRLLTEIRSALKESE